MSKVSGPSPTDCPRRRSSVHRLGPHFENVQGGSERIPRVSYSCWRRLYLTPWTLVFMYVEERVDGGRIIGYQEKQGVWLGPDWIYYFTYRTEKWKNRLPSTTTVINSLTLRGTLWQKRYHYHLSPSSTPRRKSGVKWTDSFLVRLFCEGPPLEYSEVS